MVTLAGEKICVPEISILMAVWNGAATLDRAIASVVAQTFFHWELLAIDDGSTDESVQLLERWAARDPRIRPVQCGDRRGPSAARNVGAKLALGSTITFLDCDDDYQSDYLQLVASFRNKGDVLIFNYDRVVDKSDGTEELLEPWDSADLRNDLFWVGGGMVTPLGVAVRKNLLLVSGGFNEHLWWDEDGDLWKRLARMGSSFVYVRRKCGRYHIREGSRSRIPQILDHQRESAEINFRAGKPLYHNPSGVTASRHPVQRVLFASAHSLIDHSNGASLATLDLLQTLAAGGLDCHAFCMPKLDFEKEICFEKMVADLGEPYEIRNSICGNHRARVLHTRRGRVPFTVLRVRSTRHMRFEPGEFFSVLGFFQKFLESYRPDVMLTYGADAITHAMIALAKRRDVPIVFAIHNFAYTDLNFFWKVDQCIVPSKFARHFYWDNVGLACDTLPNPVDWERVLATNRKPQFLTFINPSPEKGVYAFASIAQELGRRRPDIPILVVESRGTRETVMACGLAESSTVNIRFMRNTTDPRCFWSMTKVALMPSLWWENQPAVAYEAMINGIPVVGSDRGGIPEALGHAGYLLPLPDWMTPATRVLPTAEEVEPWVDTIVHLWDDQNLYEDQQRRALIEAQRWHPERLRPLHVEYFREVRPQPGPPFIPKLGV